MMIMGVTIFLAAMIILMNFLSDMLYKVMDPSNRSGVRRWKYDQRKRFP